MKGLISITLLIIAYILLRFDFWVIEPWIKALLAVLIVIAALLVYVISPGKVKPSFKSFKRFGSGELIFISGMFTLFVIGLFFIVWLGPSVAVEARNLSQVGMGYGSQVEGKDKTVREFISPRNGDGVVVGTDEDPEIRIPKRGSINFAAFPEVWVSPLNDKSKLKIADDNVYLTLKNFENFDGKSSWLPEDAGSSYIEAKNGWIDIVEEPSSDSIHYEVSHSRLYKLLHCLQGLERVRLSSLKGYGGVGYSLPLLKNSSKKHRSYECISSHKRLKDFSDQELESLESGKGFEHLARNDFLNSFRKKIQGLKAKFSGLGSNSAGEKAKIIQQYLKNSFRYSLEVRNLRDLPPIENFLFAEKVGFCLHFASAGVILCRELGIPARLAYGYAGGVYFPKRNRRVLYTNNAHAWLEINIEGHGWVIVETTPEEGIQSNWASADDEPAEIPTHEERMKRQVDSDQVVPSQNLGLVFKEAKVVLFLITILSAVLVAIGCWQKSSRKRRSREASDSDDRHKIKDRPYIAIYRKMSHLNGLPMMDGDTLLAHIHRLNEINAAPDFADELLNYHYNTVYREWIKDSSRELSLMKKIRKWKR